MNDWKPGDLVWATIVFASDVRVVMLVREATNEEKYDFVCSPPNNPALKSVVEPHKAYIAIYGDQFLFVWDEWVLSKALESELIE